MCRTYNLIFSLDIKCFGQQIQQKSVDDFDCTVICLKTHILSPTFDPFLLRLNILYDLHVSCPFSFKKTSKQPPHTLLHTTFTYLTSGFSLNELYQQGVSDVPLALGLAEDLLCFHLLSLLPLVILYPPPPFRLNLN